MMEIKLSGVSGAGMVTVVDDDVYKKYGSMKWFLTRGANRNNYVMRRFGKRSLPLHRIVNNTPNGLFTDHINGDTLDNRRSNLRTCTNRENQFNSMCHADKSSVDGVIPPKGIFYDKTRPNIPWVGKIIHNGKRICTKGHKTIEEAKVAYNELALSFRGKFARID